MFNIWGRRTESAGGVRRRPLLQRMSTVLPRKILETLYMQNRAFWEICMRYKMGL